VVLNSLTVKTTPANELFWLKKYQYAED